jgi:hypothetical protein
MGHMEPHSSSTLLGEEMLHRQDDVGLLESFCTVVNEMAVSREFCRSHFDRTHIFRTFSGLPIAPIWIRQCKCDYFLAALAAIRARKLFSC